MPNRFPSAPRPVLTLQSHHETLLVLKEVAEILAQQRGDVLLSAVTWADLLALELITPDQAPKQAPRRGT